MTSDSSQNRRLPPIFMALKRIRNLSPPRSGYRLRDPAPGGNLTVGLLVRSEDQVEHREKARVIAVLIGFVASMVPVVEDGRGDEEPQRTEREAQIGVDERRVELLEENEPRERWKGESQDHDGEVRRAEHVDGLEGVLAVSGQPVQLLDTVVDGVHLPEPGHGMRKSMRPVAAKLRENDDLEELDGHRLPGNQQAEALRHESPQGVGCHSQEKRGPGIDQERIQREMEKIMEPASPEHGLSRPSRKEALGRDEQCEEEEKEEADLFDHGNQ